MARKKTTKVAKPAPTPVSVDKSRAGFMLHAKITTHAQPHAERNECFDPDAKQIGYVGFKPQLPNAQADGLIAALRNACSNAYHMGATEIRIKIRRKWYNDTSEAD